MCACWKIRCGSVSVVLVVVVAVVVKVTVEAMIVIIIITINIACFNHVYRPSSIQLHMYTILFSIRDMKVTSSFCTHFMYEKIRVEIKRVKTILLLSANYTHSLARFGVHGDFHYYQRES